MCVCVCAQSWEVAGTVLAFVENRHPKSSSSYGPTLTFSWIFPPSCSSKLFDGTGVLMQQQVKVPWRDGKWRDELAKRSLLNGGDFKTNFPLEEMFVFSGNKCFLKSKCNLHFPNGRKARIAPNTNYTDFNFFGRICSAHQDVWGRFLVPKL